MATKAAQAKATTKYIKNHMRSFTVRFNNEREADEIAWLESQENVTATIKRLIREEMRKDM